MSQHGPPPTPPGSPIPGTPASGAPAPATGPGDGIFPGRLNQQAAPDVSQGVPNAGTAPRPGRVADEAFVRALYAEHGGALLRYALHLAGGDRQRAEDLVQETIVRAWRHPEALADRPARPWLFAVARNLAVDSYRARQARPPETGQAALELLPSDDDADRTLESWAVADALASLRPDHRRVIVETYYRGCSVAEAAATLGIPAGTVKSRTFYALKAPKLALPGRGRGGGGHRRGPVRRAELDHDHADRSGPDRVPRHALGHRRGDGQRRRECVGGLLARAVGRRVRGPGGQDPDRDHLPAVGRPPRRDADSGGSLDDGQGRGQRLVLRLDGGLLAADQQIRDHRGPQGLADSRADLNQADLNQVAGMDDAARALFIRVIGAWA